MIPPDQTRQIFKKTFGDSWYAGECSYVLYMRIQGFVKFHLKMYACLDSSYRSMVYLELMDILPGD